MKKLWMLLAVIVILVPVSIWYFAPEKVLQRRAKHLIEVISMSEGTGGALRQAKVFSMNAMLAPEVELVIPDIGDANGTFDKQELESGFSWICQNAKLSDFRIIEYRKIEVNGETGMTHIRVRGFMELPTGRPAEGVFDVVIHWKKGGDGWRFHKIVWETI